MFPCDVYFYSYSNLPLQDYLFRLVPGYVDSGKGKCSYDPTQENIAVLISKSCIIYEQKKKTQHNTALLFFQSNLSLITQSPGLISPSSHRLTSADGNLYAGVHIDFMSTDAALFRTMGGRTAIRTEQYDSRWLNGE